MSKALGRIMFGVLLCLSLGACTTPPGQPPGSAEVDAPEAQATLDELLKQADYWMRQGEFQQVIDVCTQIVAAYPQSAKAYIARGYAYLCIAGQLQAAAAANVPAPSGIAAAYTCTDAFDRAIDDYTKALQINPQDAQAYSQRGVAYSQQRKWAQARRDYEEAMQLDPDGRVGQDARDNLEVLRQQGH